MKVESVLVNAAQRIIRQLHRKTIVAKSQQIAKLDLVLMVYVNI
jgi:hypothetical protein